MIFRYKSLLPEFPSLTVDYGISSYNDSKVALLIENRPLGILAPLMLHMISVVPPDWRFRFMGSEESVAHLNRSAAIRRRVGIGKLDLTYIPSNMSVSGHEQISQFLTNYWIYETVLQPAEFLLVFQTDSKQKSLKLRIILTGKGILCGNSQDNLDEWLKYDWVGAPWSVDGQYGGNGGLSVRRVSSILTILRHQQRINNTEPEDAWLTERLAHLPSARLANGTESLNFSVESIWVDRPMGYHTGGSGSILLSGVWGIPEHRMKIWAYCPEVKITLPMDMKSYMPELCEGVWN